MISNRRSPLTLCLLFLIPTMIHADLTFDANTTTTDIQNGSGDWDVTTANWWNGSGDQVWNNDGSATAYFGTSATATGGTVTVKSPINLAGMRFNSFSGLPTGSAYTLTGGTLAFSNDAVIEMADNSSSGSSGVLFVNLNSTHTGHNLTLQRDAAGLTGAQTFQYIRFGAANPDLTGKLTLKALSSSKGIFLLTVSSAAVAGFSDIVVENGSVFAPSGASNTYANNIMLSGTGSGNGAIRVDAAGIDFSGVITLAADAAINTNSNIATASISGSLVESGGAFGFQRLAATQNSMLYIRGANTFTGATTLGRSGGVAAGNTILDFTAATAPADDILYHETTAGPLSLWGGTAGGTTFTLQGKAAADHVQHFGNATANGTRSNIILTPGASGGTMTLAIGTVSRTSSASVGFVIPSGATVTTTSGEGLLGPWATVSNGSGGGSWAAVSSGSLTNYQGDLIQQSGTAINALPGYAATGNLNISSSSSGDVTTGGSTVTIGTVSMTDTVARTLDIGSGNTLRMGTVGGIQIIGGAQSLDVGLTGSAGTLTGSTSASQLWLTNMSSTSRLTINSAIANNGSGVLSVYVNGIGNTILSGSNSFTGALQVGSGSLELRDSGAAGTSAGGIAVLYGASLRLAGGITVGDALSVTGFGVATDGALRNVSGDNTLTGLVTLNNPTRINSDSGTLILTAAAATNSITGSQLLTFGGAGTVQVDGRIATSSGSITKDGNGTLRLAGDNTFTSTLTISAGTVQAAHANALGTTAGITSVTTGAVLEVSGGITLAAEPISLSSTGVNLTGGLRNGVGDNTVTGLVTVNGVARIQSDAGTLTFDSASGNSIMKDTSSSARSLTFGGAGDVVVLDPIAKSTSGTAGLFNIFKDGAGTLTLRASNTYDGATTVAAGTVHLDFSAAASPAANILYNGLATAGGLTMGGGTLKITGKNGAANSQAFGALTMNSGQSYLTVAQNGAATVTVSTGAWTRALQGGVLNITLPTTGSLTTTGGVDNAIISQDNIAYAVAGTDDWAATTAAAAGVRKVVGLSSISGGYTGSTGTALTGNADVTLGETATTLGGSATISSLRFNANQATTITVGTGNILTTGGILVGSGAMANTSTITGGTLRSASTAVSNNNADLVVIQNNLLGDLVISSVISNNATAASVTGLTKSGPGRLVLEGATHAYTGTTRVQNGILQLRSGSISASTEFTLGSGSSSGKIVLGSGATGVNLTGDWLRIDGIGGANAVVGGATALSTFLLDNDSASDFRRGYLGGSGANENNLSLTLTAPSAVLQLGGANTYKGKTSILRGTIEVELLANTGAVSSLGTGDFSGSTSTIDMASQTTGAVGSFATAILRYTGATDSSTNRIINITNNDVATDITTVTAVIENAGTGSLKFTSAFTAGGSNPVGRTLRLEGSNTGANEIVGIGNASTTILTSLVKNGAGTWLLTGNSAYSGGTTVNAGSLLVANTGVGGSAVGTGAVLVQSSGTFGGAGRVSLAADQSITIAAGGRLSVGNSTLALAEAGILELNTSGSGSVQFDSGSELALDLIERPSGDAVYGAADLLRVNGGLSALNGVTLTIGNPLDIGDFSEGNQWRLFDWSGLTEPISSSFQSVDLPAMDGNLQWDLTRLYTDGSVMILLVPEPSRVMLLFAALAFVGFQRRRKAG